MTRLTDAVVDDKPRMTAADADARFAALVAEHRAAKPVRGMRAVASGSTDQRGALVFVVVFCVGVAAGALFHVKPLLAIVLGAPVVYFARILFVRSRDRSGAS